MRFDKLLHCVPVPTRPMLTLTRLETMDGIEGDITGRVVRKAYCVLTNAV
jgi:hypothetical protein